MQDSTRTSEQRQAQSLNLSDAEMARIAALDRGERLASPEGLAPAWD